MAKFTNLTLTEKGLALQTKAQTGTQLKFTRVAIGDGIIDGGVSLNSLIQLASERMSVAIANLSIDNGSAVIKANFSNKDLIESFYLRELGVFANDPDDGEILYAVAYAGDQSDYLPDYNGSEVIEQTFTLSLVVGNAADVTATFAESIYVLKAGDTMTGPLVLSGDPTANLHAVTKQYVDNSFWDYYGTADPTTVSGVTVKPMFRWADATNKIIKIRNFLNTAWIPFMDMETGNILTNAATSNNAANVTTNINGHAITDIFESDGVTSKNATNAITAKTGPNTSWGFYYPTGNTTLSNLYTINNIKSDSGYSWEYLVGPTGSGCYIIFTQLDSLPIGVKAIKYKIFHRIYSNNIIATPAYCRSTAGLISRGNFDTSVVFTGTSSYFIDYSDEDCSQNDISIDSNKRLRLFITGVGANVEYDIIIKICIMGFWI